jgi:hypothetical protein
MAKTPTNHGKDWTAAEIKKLGQLARQNTPTQVAALKLGRTPAAVAQKASFEGISMKPKNRRPYGARKKYQRTWPGERPQFMRSRDLWPLTTFPGGRRGCPSALPYIFRLPMRALARAIHTLRQGHEDLTRPFRYAQCRGKG